MCLFRNVSLFIKDPHPRVRWCAVNCLGNLCASFKSSVTQEISNDIFACFVGMTEDPVARVATHAVKCLINFIEMHKNPEEFSCSYRDPLMSLLIKFLNEHQTIYAQEVGIRTLIVLIKALDKYFEPYYNIIMPYFRNIMTKVHQPEGEILRGLVVEGASLAGKAVERERFIGDAKFILDAMSRVNMLNKSNPMIGYVESALCTFAEILGEDFTSFMPKVIPFVLEQAAMEVQNREVDKELEDDGDDDQNKSDYYYDGDKTILYNLSQAKEKAESIYSLGVYAYATKANFINHAEEAFNIVMKEIDFEFYTDVRKNAFYSMEHILRSVALARIKNDAYSLGLQKMIKKILEVTTERIQNKDETWDVRIAAIDALKGVFLVVNKQIALNDSTSEHIAMALGNLFVPWAKKIVSEKYDDDDDDNFFLVFRHVQECIEAILQGHCKSFIGPYLKYIHKAVLSLATLENDESPDSSLRVLASIAQYIPPPLDPALFTDIVNAHLELAKSFDETVLQTVCTGLETLIECHQEELRPRYEEVSAVLTGIIGAATTKDSQDILIVQDTAVVSLGVLIYGYGPRPDSSDLKLFISRIPLVHCREAGEKAHKLFCVFTQMYYQKIIGQNNENAPIVIQIFANIIKSGFITQETKRDIVSISRNLAESVNERILVSNLTPELLEVFRNLIGQYST